MIRNETAKNEQGKFSNYLELFIVCSLSISIAVIFFNAPRWTRAFGEAGFAALLLWALYHKRQPLNRIPQFVIIMAVLYILSYVINVFRSPDPTWEHVDIRKYIYIITGGLLFAFPVKKTYRRFMVVVLFCSAAVAGAAGIYQHFSEVIGTRSEGFSGNPLHYAGLLGIVFCTSVVMIFIANNNYFKSKYRFILLTIVAVLTFSGILFSQARGVWVAVVFSCMITLFYYDLRKAVLFLFFIGTILLIAFVVNGDLRGRAVSIVTSPFEENASGNTGTRIELWKGSLMIFQEVPLFGVGTGNFDSNIARLVAKKKIKDTVTKVHAHNIYLQALATRGIIGFAISMFFFAEVLKWGMNVTKERRSADGYMMIICMVYIMISGLTENNVEFTRFLAACSLTIGLLGAYECENAAIKD